MKLTAQEEYGLRCILTLAREQEQAQEHLPGNGDDSPSGSALSSASGPDRYLTVGDISRLEGISPQYAGKLIRILGKAGLVLSVRGCKGGYRLARKASKIRVSEILDVLGSKIYDPDLCDRHRGDRPFCVHSNDCAVRSLWTGIQLLVDQVLSNTSLHELISSERTMAQWMVDHLALVLTQVTPASRVRKTLSERPAKARAAKARVGSPGSTVIAVAPLPESMYVSPPSRDAWLRV